MPSRRSGQAAKRRDPRIHEGPSGFTWHVELPERASAPMGARKPLARIVVSEGEGLQVPVAVARRLDAMDDVAWGSRAELLYHVGEVSDACCWEKLVDLVSRRDYSTSEMASRLVREGYSRARAEGRVEYACELKIMSDARFAEYFIRAKVAAGWGPVRIERELSRRGIEASEVAGWPEAFLEQDDVSERASKLLARKAVPEKNAYAKFVRFLVSRGYPMAIAKEAALDRIHGDEGEC